MKPISVLALSCLLIFPAVLAQDIRNAPPPTVPDRASRGAMFLTRIRLADPDYRVILMACLKENELNLLLSRHVTDEEIPTLVKGLLAQLSQQLPGEDLQVIAFKPIVPLRESGVAALDHRTGRVRYTSAHLPGKAPDVGAGP